MPSHLDSGTTSVETSLRNTQVVMAVHSDYHHDHRVRNQAEALHNEGYAVTVLCVNKNTGNDTPQTYIADGITLIVHTLKFASGKKRFISMMKQFHQTLKQLPCDIIHAHDLDTLLPCRLAAARHQAKLVYDSHELYTESVHVAHRSSVKMIWKFLETLLIGKADKVITVCDGIARELQTRYQLSEKPAVVRNFSDAGEYTPVSPGNDFEAFRNRYPFIAIYQGYLQRGRGILEAIEAISKLNNWGLIICGEGPLREDSEAFAAKVAPERVLFTGNLDLNQLHAITTRCDVGLCLIEPVSLSYYYALPNKLIEYLQAGIPVIGSDLPEIRNIVLNYHTGAILRKDEDLAETLIRFETLKEDKSIKDSLIIAAQSLNWQSEKKRLFQAYSALTDHA